MVSEEFAHGTEQVPILMPSGDEGMYALPWELERKMVQRFPQNTHVKCINSLTTQAENGKHQLFGPTIPVCDTSP